MARAFKPGNDKSLKSPKTRPEETAEGGSLWLATARWISSLKSEIPKGYEDETGFHYGDGSVPGREAQM